MQKQGERSVKRLIWACGEWVDSGDTFTVISPFSNEKIADVATADENIVESSIDASSEAARQMKSMPRFRIAKALRFIAAEIERRKSEFINSIVLEAAKPIIYARSEVERAIATFSFAASEAERFTGEVVPVDAQAGGLGKWARTVRVPRGVIYGITPFNFPLNLVAHKVAPALASGNAVIIKPSPRTPLTSLLLAEVFAQCGLPGAALQVVPADVAFVKRYIEDERVAMLSFTGSADVGWKLKAQVGKKAIALELGGAAPVIIDRSADFEKSLSRCLTGAFAYSGQVCISVQRIYVESEIFPQWVDEFSARAEKLHRGDPSNENTQISVMIDEAAAIRTENWVNEALDGGAKLVTGGKREGNFFDPTVLTDTDPEMKVVAEEVFAPVVAVESFDEFSAAVEMANNSKYGLQAGIFSQNAANIEYAAENLEYGGVIVNDAPIFRVDNMPYGGVKASGFGREGVRYAMEEMTEPRLIVYDR